MTFMQTEILQTPSILARSYDENLSCLKAVAKKVKENNITNVIVAARGSSMNAGFILKNLVESSIPNLLVSFELPSLATLYKAKRDLSKTLYVVVSQSGASTDTITMLNEAKENGAIVLAVTNNPNSACATGAHLHFNLCAGEEKAVAATKTFTSEIFAMLLLSRALAGTLEDFDIDYIIGGAEQILQSELPKIPCELISANGVMALSRGITECVAKECGLKLMECCYKFVYSGSTNEFQHGPKALLKAQQPVILIAPSGSKNAVSCKEDYIKTAEILRELDTFIIAITDIDEVSNLADMSINLPDQKDGCEAIFTTLSVQLLVLSLSLALGLNPDAPRNLKKVTITK
ncbi:MAG TPA: SIS domain-containing protein [Clostridia bacterium]|nr:SIS domain-containing protein [Clostridia bacterium]